MHEPFGQQRVKRSRLGEGALILLDPPQPIERRGSAGGIRKLHQVLADHVGGFGIAQKIITPRQPPTILAQVIILREQFPEAPIVARGFLPIELPVIKDSRRRKRVGIGGKEGIGGFKLREILGNRRRVRLLRVHLDEQGQPLGFQVGRGKVGEQRLQGIGAPVQAQEAPRLPQLPIGDHGAGGLISSATRRTLSGRRHSARP